MRPPSPKDDWNTWKAFHAALVEALHTHPDLLIACDMVSMDDLRADESSPWTNGGCGLLAFVLVGWINNPRRATWQMLARVGSWSPKPVYAHALVVYKHDTLGPIYFDGVTMTRSISDMHYTFHTEKLLTRTRDSNAYMDENFDISPTGDPRRIELMLQVLLNTFGRWPK